jgi:DNA primase
MNATRDVIAEIKDKVDFPDLVGETIPLSQRPNGRPVLVLCPFHNETTPSLAVYEDGAHCFGCGWHGDAFDWLQKRDGLDFRGALDVLARRARVELTPLTPQQQQAIETRRRYEEALAEAARHFADRLGATPAALDYAQGRGWDAETARAELLGFADGSPLPDVGNAKAQAVAEAVNRWAGRHGGALVYAHHDGARVVYFAGRSLEGKAHYNPPADLAGPRRPYQNAAYARHADRLAIVEGQACAVTLGGWKVPAVALAGSSVTGDLAQQLADHAERGAIVYAIPDGDGKTDLEAIAEAVGPELLLVTLPDGIGDANAWAQTGATPEDLEALLAEAEPWLDRQIEEAAAQSGPARDRALEDLLPWLLRLPTIAQTRYKKRVMDAFGIGARDYNRLLKDARQEDQRAETRDGDRYTIEDGRFCAVRFAGGQAYTEPLCNFSAAIVEDVAKDDGTGDLRRFFTVRGRLADGSALPTGQVDAGKFAGLNWINELWGVRAVIRAGRNTKDQLREAIQLQSADVTSRHIFTHTGWREIEGRRVYLTNGGAVGDDGVTVELERGLRRYTLPTQPDDGAEAMRASLRFLDVAPLEITAPLWAAAFLAPLAEIVYPDFMLWLYGKTGTLKSTLAALLLSHYGRFDDESTLPASWGDTANRLEVSAFMLKDAPLVIDDFCPQSDPYRARRMEGNVAQVVRNVGNREGRGRLRRDLTMATTYKPRGLVISTGEQIPDTQSVAARIFTLELRPDDVNMERLSAAQAEAERYPHALAGYLRWIAPQWEELAETLPAQVRDLRDQARVTLGGLHLRLPAALALLYTGLELGLAFAVEAGAITETEAEDLRARGWEALRAGSIAQAQRVEAERPTVIFLDVLGTLLGQGKVFLLDKDGIGGKIGGGAAGEEKLGWYDAEHIYLQGGAAYNRVARFLRDQGETFPVKKGTLRKYMVEEGLLLAADEGRKTAVVRIGGATHRALWLDRAKVEEIAGELPPARGGDG